MLKTPKISEYIECIPKNEKVFLYHTITGEKIITTNKIFYLFNQISNNPVNNNNFDSQIMKLLIKKGFLYYANEDAGINLKKQEAIMDKIQEGIYIRNLRLNITEKCNLNCTYCYEKTLDNYVKGREMTWEIAQKSIDEFSRILLMNNHKSGTIRFFGGEPLLNYDLVLKSIEYANSKYKDSLCFEYIINTNGTLLTSKIASTLSKFNVTVVISLDGKEEFNDISRKFYNGKGSFNIVSNNLRYLAENNCKTNIAIVCNDNNYPHLIEFIDYLLVKSDELKFKFNICFSNIHISKQNGEKVLNNDTKVQYLIQAIRYCKQNKINCYGGLSHQVFDNMIKPNGGRHCVCLGSELSVDPSGAIYPCDGLCIKLGDIFNIDKIFKSDNYTALIRRLSGNINKCHGCKIEAYCAGGCLADFMSHEGKNANSCRNSDLEIKLFQELVKEYILY